jgi:hypothetical protein
MGERGQAQPISAHGDAGMQGRGIMDDEDEDVQGRKLASDYANWRKGKGKRRTENNMGKTGTREWN